MTSITTMVGEPNRERARRRRICARCVGLAGLALAVLGVLHIAVGLPDLVGFVDRGLMAQRIAGPQMVNWVFSGSAMFTFGLLSLSWSRDLRRGCHSAWRSALVAGAFFVAVGVGAYQWERRPAVLVFASAGVLSVAPLVWARSSFAPCRAPM